MNTIIRYAATSSRPKRGARSFARALALALAVLASAFATSCGGARPHQALDSRAEPLRSAFNADSGKVRVVILASPT